jgi:hypothetical protein
MKTDKVQRNNAPSKTLKKYGFETKKLKNKQKFQLIWKYGQILTIQNSLLLND